jgi:RimJ/RimL family protein N-acetyltransferase
VGNTVAARLVPRNDPLHATSAGHSGWCCGVSPLRTPVACWRWTVITRSCGSWALRPKRGLRSRSACCHVCWLLTRSTVDFGFWAADTRSDGAFTGCFGLRPVTAPAPAIVHLPSAPPDSYAAVAELGYRLRRGAWGHGYATEGARALIQHAFSKLGLMEIVATTMTVNTRSRRVLEKAGLRYARNVHPGWPDALPGEYDDAGYRLHRNDWRRE